MSDAKQKTVFLVDDDQDFVLQTKFRLEQAGYNVETSDSQADAESRLESVKPDVAVVDLMLEHQDSGFVLSHHIKKIFPKMPVILVTGVAAETGMEFDSTTGEERSWIKADRVIAKPIRFEQLASEIAKLVTG
jgi:two-component system, OmpR family, response regulator